MIVCIRCTQPRQPQEMCKGRRHCQACQARAARISYYRHRWRQLDKNARRRAAEYGCDVQPVDYGAIFAADIAHPCGMCGQHLNPITDEIEFDHIQPLAEGGPHAPHNIRLVHRACNREASMRRFVLAKVLNRRVA